ncbi:polyketide cyclase [Nonomuraea sp. FMUSA5-5]|uniref:Polyketide cyclase n=1 Tax=Nonomuraea composti TaxID=2720023 RepID=A0ABX1B5U5_9ACTN|nr:SRPBCC domain-containing protein [Nonomuraea sp. FMUSA5-5]NJP92207.1 polyketide cyclase [Nonomuraea sp. FMUSA5-5]
MSQDTMNATLTVAVPAAKLFAALADPATHASIDGTGWVREPVDRAPLTEAGQVFRMNMHHDNHPDGDYRTANQIQVFEPPHAIGWRTGTEGDDGELRFGGWWWRYDLVPLDESKTEVTLTYDWSAVPQPIRQRIQFPPFGPEHLIDSLRHLADLVS